MEQFAFSKIDQIYSLAIRNKIQNPKTIIKQFLVNTFYDPISNLSQKNKANISPLFHELKKVLKNS
jgi:hypothetical protein